MPCRTDGPSHGGDGAREERIDIQGEGALLPSFFCRPDGQTAPAVLIIHDVYGANDFYHDVARRLAGEGFAALLPDLFVRQGPLAEQTMDAARARAMHLDEPTAMKDIARAIRWLEQHEESTGK